MTTISDNKAELLAVAVASGQAIKDAAEDCGFSVSRAYHVSASVDFKCRVSEIRQQVLDGAVGRLNAAATRAVDALIAVLDSGEDKDRITAAKTVLSLLGPISELGELRARLDRLEHGNTQKGRAIG